MPIFFDPIYLIIVSVPALILSGGASLWLRAVYHKFKNTANSQGITGVDVATQINNSYNFGAGVGVGGGQLIDNYNPIDHQVTLSEEVANLSSIASVAIAAHEFGHVQQYAENSLMIRFRSFLVPIVNFGSNIGYFLVIAGLLFNFLGLSWIGVILFSTTTIFSLVTLPVEFDASRRGLDMIQKLGLLGSDEIKGAKAVLRVAAFTYVAGAIVSLLNLLYFVFQILVASRSND